jgi:hypothetical protein
LDEAMDSEAGEIVRRAIDLDAKMDAHLLSESDIDCWEWVIREIVRTERAQYERDQIKASSHAGQNHQPAPFRRH